MRNAGQLLRIWRKLSVAPGGRQLFSRLICFETPWAAGIRPVFEILQPGLIEVSMRKRRCVLNSDGNIHSMAVCTLAELAAHTATRATLPAAYHYLIHAMSVNFPHQAYTHLTAVARIQAMTDKTNPVEQFVHVDIRNTSGTLVSQAQVTLRITSKRQGTTPHQAP